jgi:hypothetical protein
VRIAAESEPASGSVIAIAAQRPSKRSSCSSSPTEAIAELPSPWRGMESRSPTSPQQSSMIESAVDMFEPLRFSPSPPAERRTPAAPAPPIPVASFTPSMTAASMSSSFGRACSSRS